MRTPAWKKSASQGETKVTKYCRGWQVGEKNLQQGRQHYKAGAEHYACPSAHPWKLPSCKHSQASQSVSFARQASKTGIANIGQDMSEKM